MSSSFIKTWTGRYMLLSRCAHETQEMKHLLKPDEAKLLQRTASSTFMEMVDEAKAQLSYQEKVRLMVKPKNISREI